MSLLTRCVTVAALTLAVATGATLASGAASAQVTAGQTLDPIATSGVFLQQRATYLPGRVDALDAELPKIGVQNLLDAGNRQGAWNGDCAAPALNGVAGVVDRFCFEHNTGTDDNDVTYWTPQGVTTTADAQADDYWGTKQAVLVSWYHTKSTDPNDGGHNKGVRVSFVDADTGRYRHVLLVWPYENSFGNISFTQLEYDVTDDGVDNPLSLHAGGMVWYGNYLYVTDTHHGIRVFDMRKIMEVDDTSDPTLVGRHDGTYSAYGYRYVMPQVGAWVTNDMSTSDPCGATDPCFSYAGLDRSGSDTMLTGEYRASADHAARRARIFRWPLDGATGELSSSGGRVSATEAYALPAPRIQGVVSRSGTFSMGQSNSADNPGTLFTARSGESPTGRQWGVGSEDLSYWPSRDLLFTVTEHPGNRIVYGARP